MRGPSANRDRCRCERRAMAARHRNLAENIFVLMELRGRTSPVLCVVRFDQAAIATRSVDFSLAGLTPGGVRGEGSRLESASRISSIDTTLFVPGIARRFGQEVTAAASDAQDASIARFSA